MSDDLRVLPFSLEAERAVLGAILVHGDLILKAQQRIQPRDFFRRAHQILFDVFCVLAQSRAAIDLVTTTEEIKRRGQAVVDEVGGAAYISSLTDGVPRSANVTHYAGIVKEHAMRRGAIRAANDLLTAAYEGTAPVAEMIAKADRAIIDLQHAQTAERMVDLRQSTLALVDKLDARTKNRGNLLGIPTGFESIDALTCGWQAGDMTVIAARPSIGKTALALNTATAAARAGHGVLIFSLEMRREQLEYRLLSALSGVPLTKILGGWLHDDDFAQLAPAVNDLHTMPIWVDDRSGQDVWDIRASTRRLKAERKIDLVIVDYFQLMTGALEGRHNRNEQLSDASRRLKVLADEVSCPILVLSQLNRGGDIRSDKRPILSDLRDTGALEQDADNVCFLHRKHHRESGLTEFIIEKQRNGPTGVVNLTITRETQRFENAGMEPEAEPLPEPEQVAPKRGRKWPPRLS